MQEPRGQFRGDRDGASIRHLPSAAPRFPFILCLRIPDRLPLHVRGCVRPSAHERHNVISDPAGARAARQPDERTGVGQLELVLDRGRSVAPGELMWRHYTIQRVSAGGIFANCSIALVTRRQTAAAAYRHPGKLIRAYCATNNLGLCRNILAACRGDLAE